MLSLLCLLRQALTPQSNLSADLQSSCFLTLECWDYRCIYKCLAVKIFNTHNITFWGRRTTENSTNFSPPQKCLSTDCFIYCHQRHQSPMTGMWVALLMLSFTLSLNSSLMMPGPSNRQSRGLNGLRYFSKEAWPY